MPRVIAIAPGGRAQAPVRDDRFRPVIEVCVQAGLLGRPLLSPVCRTMDQADDARRGLYRSARYWCGCGEPNCTRKHRTCPRGGQRISVRADIVRDGQRRLRVQFRLWDKQEARREIVRRYGPDPNAWPYYARRKQLKETGHA